MNQQLNPIVASQALATGHLESVALKLKACGDSLRVQILLCLRSDAFGVLELTQIFDAKQSGMSHHLKVLSKAGLVEAQREGNSIFYRRPIQSNFSVDGSANLHLFALIDELSLSPEISRRMQQVRDQRAEQSTAFFNRNSERFAEQQELICNHEQYADTSFELLSSAVTIKSASVLEIGPGEGQFLTLLGRHYSTVDAVDTSAQMLLKARKLCSESGLKHVRLIEGEASSLASQVPGYAGIVMNMVLHHVPAPAALFHDCAQLLEKDGALVVCDLSHHNQEWTKENCGDLWMGFETKELEAWAQDAGFEIDDSVFIGLRNGFQIQVHRFIKQ